MTLEQINIWITEINLNWNNQNVAFISDDKWSFDVCLRSGEQVRYQQVLIDFVSKGHGLEPVDVLDIRSKGLLVNSESTYKEMMEIAASRCSLSAITIRPVYFPNGRSQDMVYVQSKPMTDMLNINLLKVIILEVAILSDMIESGYSGGTDIF